MGLRIIYGKAGTGKSEFCFQEIASRIHNPEKIYIITPEQFSFHAEKKLLETIKTNAVISAEVLTFRRMAYRVESEVGSKAEKVLSDAGKSMLIYDILEKNNKELMFLGKSDKNIDLVSTSLTELKKHNIKIEELKKMIENTEDIYLKNKLQDIILLYEKFEDRIQHHYIDENDVLTNLYNSLDQTTMFQNSIFYLDEFSGFTPQEYQLIRKLLHIASQVNITICTNGLETSKNIDTDIFYSNKVTVDKLVTIAKQENITIEKPIYLPNPYRFRHEELKHLEENLYDIPYQKYEDKCDWLQLFLSMNPYTEMEYVANQIVKLVKEENYRYREISIITKNIDQYSSLAKAIFHQYEIPIFIDEKKDLNQNLLVKYILAVLEVFSKNWSYEAMFNYIKTGLCDITEQECFQLENYCLKWGIKYSKWYQEDWKFESDNIETINDIRNRVVQPLLKFKKHFTGRKTVEEITKAIYEFLVVNKVDKKLQEKIEKLEDKKEIEKAREYGSSWNIIIDLFDEVVFLFGEEFITFERYAELLKTGLKNTELGKIPEVADQVIIGDIERSRSHRVKAVFIIGLNDGIFPSVNKQEGFLNDQDREKLKQNGMELAKGTLDRIYEDNFNIYKALTTAEEKIYLSYVSTDNEGKSLRPSILVSKIKKIFPNLKEESDIIEKKEEILQKNVVFEELLTNIRKWVDGEELNPIWFVIYQIYYQDDLWKDKLQKAIQALEYTNQPQKLSQDNIQKLYGETLKTSVSKLEQYRSCPFSFYLKYGLKLSDKDMFQIETMDTGSFMHEVIDEFFDIVKTKDISLKEITENEIFNIVSNIIEDKLKLKKNYIFTSTPKYRLLSQRLKNLVVKSMKYIIHTIVDSDFEVMGNEVEFKEGGDYPPITISLENGQTVEITGKIDRIDLAKNGKGSYIRIIDYKSSIKNIDLNEVMAGLQIQLLTYLDAIVDKNITPAGVFYFNLIDPIIKADKNMTEEELEEKIKNEFKMKGLILADVNVVKMMDKSLEKGASNVIPAYIDAGGNISTNKPSVLKKEQFQLLQDNIKQTIRDISKEILSGNIEVKPYYSISKKKTPCQYCKYQSICQFTPGFCHNQYRYIENKTKDEILETIIKNRKEEKSEYRN